MKESMKYWHAYTFVFCINYSCTDDRHNLINDKKKDMLLEDKLLDNQKEETRLWR